MIDRKANFLSQIGAPLPGRKLKIEVGRGMV